MIISDKINSRAERMNLGEKCCNIKATIAILDDYRDTVRSDYVGSEADLEVARVEHEDNKEMLEHLDVSLKHLNVILENGESDLAAGETIPYEHPLGV